MISEERESGRGEISGRMNEMVGGRGERWGHGSTISVINSRLMCASL